MYLENMNGYFPKVCRQCVRIVSIGPATRCDEMGNFPAILSFYKHHRSSYQSPYKLQQFGQSATHNGMFSYSSMICITAMVTRNI